MFYSNNILNLVKIYLDYTMRKNILLLFIIITTVCSSQKTYIPDDNFEQKLINLGYDNVLDDSIVTVTLLMLSICG